MCNWLGSIDCWEIQTEGVGYKIFIYSPTRQDDPYALRSLCNWHYYDTDDAGWATWKERDLGVGFCFFKTRADAEAALKRWNTPPSWPDMKYCIRKIQYRNGKGGKHERNMFIEPPGIDMMIAGDFRLAINGRYHL